MNHSSSEPEPSPFEHLVGPGIILIVALGGAYLHFLLISDAMAAMVGGDAAIGSLSVAQIAALVMVVTGINLGICLMDSLGVTRLFPVIGSLPKQLQTRMAFVSLFLLVALAASGLGAIHVAEKLLPHDDVAGSLLADWPQAGKLGVGLILPFVLAFAAVPLDSFVGALRGLLGHGPVARR